MVMLVVHHESVKNYYRAHFCSMALWFFISIALITYIVPLFLAYQSHGFWIKEHTYREQPDVHFKHEFVLFLHTTGKTIGYSTIENLNTILLGENTRFPLVRSYEVDQNLDGKNDFMKFEVQTPVLDNELIQSIQLLLFFDYRLYTYSSLHMESLAFIQFQNCIPGSEFKSNGVLKFFQKHPLPHRGSLTKYDVPIIDSSSQNILDFDLHSILSNYQTRNISTNFVGAYPVWRGHPSASIPFSIKIQIEYPEETIVYHPGFWQLIKFAWIQYLSILLVFTFFFHKVKTFVYKNQIFDTTLAVKKVHQD